jgi:hypothetical protein
VGGRLVHVVCLLLAYRGPLASTSALIAALICSGSFGQRFWIRARSGSRGAFSAFGVPLSARPTSEIGVFGAVRWICSTPLGGTSCRPRHRPFTTGRWLLAGVADSASLRRSGFVPCDARIGTLDSAARVRCPLEPSLPLRPQPQVIVNGSSPAAGLTAGPSFRWNKTRWSRLSSRHRPKAGLHPRPRRRLRMASRGAPATSPSPGPWDSHRSARGSRKQSPLWSSSEPTGIPLSPITPADR